MKIILIGNLSNTVILFRENVIKELVKNGISVYTLTIDDNEENFNTIRNYGATPMSYEFSRTGLNPLTDIINTIKLAKKIKKISPDAVLCFFPKPVIFGTFAAKLVGVKKIYTLLEGLGFCFTEHSKKDPFKKRILKFVQTFLYKIALPFSSNVLFLNQDDYNDLICKNKISINKFNIIGGIGVNLDEFSYEPNKSDIIHFGMVARLLIDKGIREYIDAAKIIKSRYPNVEFSIAGSFDDNLGGVGIEQINIWKQQGDVTFFGHLSDVKSYLKNLSVFVLPSYREGVPRSTQEAMAIGRAIITTDVPGCRETVENGHNGFLVPPWNVEKLVIAMTYFIESPQEIDSMGFASRKIAENKFDEKIVTEKMIKILCDK